MYLRQIDFAKQKFVFSLKDKSWIISSTKGKMILFHRILSKGLTYL